MIAPHIHPESPCRTCGNYALLYFIVRATLFIATAVTVTLLAWMTHERRLLEFTLILAGGALVLPAWYRQSREMRRTLYECGLPGCRSRRIIASPFCSFHEQVDKLSKQT